MTFKTFSALRTPLLTAAAFSVLLAISPRPCFGQNNVLSVAPPEKIVVKAGAPAQVKVSLDLKTGYHCNSNKPSDEYLIPLKLTWAAGPLEMPEVTYPKPEMEKYSFSDKPLSVYTGSFDLVTKFKVAASAAPGTAIITGKLRYQACTDRLCLPPKTLDISVPVDIVK